MHHEQLSERVRDVGDGLILAFPVEKTQIAGQTHKTTRLYFFRVASQTRYFQRYSALSAISSGNTTPTNNYGYLGDTGVDSGDDIFRVETDDWHLQQFGLGTNHPDLQVFYGVSPNANGEPAQDRTGQGEDITPGTDDRGWFSQAQVPDLYDPPAFTERVTFRNADRTGQFLQWAFYNDGDNQLSGAELDLFFTGRGYKVQPVMDPAVQDLMLQMAMSRPEDPTIDTVLHQVGGINEYTLGSERPDGWKELEDEFSRTLNVEDLEPPSPDDGGGRQQTQVTVSGQ